MDITDTDAPVGEVVVDADAIQERLAQMAREVERDYPSGELVVIGVLNGAIMVMADFVRHLRRDVEIDWMAVASYGSSTQNSGVVRILKDLGVEVAGKHVLLVEDVLDSGLTLRWLLRGLHARNPASLEVLTLLRKPQAVSNQVEVKYVGFDIPDVFVVGYGLDYAQRYRNLRCIAMLVE